MVALVLCISSHILQLGSQMHTSLVGRCPLHQILEIRNTRVKITISLEIFIKFIKFIKIKEKLQICFLSDNLPCLDFSASFLLFPSASTLCCCSSLSFNVSSLWYSSLWCFSLLSNSSSSQSLCSSKNKHAENKVIANARICTN